MDIIQVIMKYIDGIALTVKKEHLSEEILAANR
jgi:hypothetical protein